MLSKTYPSFAPSPFRFDMSTAAATHNSSLLAASANHFTAALATLGTGTQMEPGSEFRPVDNLDQLCGTHSLWSRARRLISHGCDIPMDDIPDAEVHQGLTLGMQRGNHKGASNQPDVLTALLEKDIHQGFALPIRMKTAHKIKGARWSPLNIIEQWTIDAKGTKT